MSTKAQDIIKVILRFIGFLSLIFITISSVFSFWGATLTNRSLVLCAFIFLISVFSEVKNWDIWGFKGESKDLSKVPEGNGISTSSVEIKQKDVEKVEQQPIQLMSNALGNFLVLAFEIERLLRILASVTLKKEIQPQANLFTILKELHKSGMVTDNGKAQVEAVTWLRNLIVHGRINEVNEQNIQAGITIAYNFYMELFNWLNNSENTNGTK